MIVSSERKREGRENSYEWVFTRELRVGETFIDSDKAGLISILKEGERENDGDESRVNQREKERGQKEGKMYADRI